MAATIPLMVVAGAVYLACSNSLLVGQHVDDASYVILAQALSRGQGYTRVAYPELPPETKYPPLLPLLIVPCLWLTGGAVWAARIPAFICAVLAIPVLWLLLRRFLEGWLLWLTVAVVALHPLVVGYAGMAMTEAPSLLLTWLTLLLVLRWEEEDKSVVWWGVLGLVLGAGMLLRADMVAVAVGVISWLAWRRRRAGAVVALLVPLALSTPWYWYSLHTAPQGDNYLREFAGSQLDPSPLPLRMLHGAQAYLGDLLPQTAGLIGGRVIESPLGPRTDLHRKPRLRA